MPHNGSKNTNLAIDGMCIDMTQCNIETNSAHSLNINTPPGMHCLDRQNESFHHSKILAEEDEWTISVGFDV